MSAENSSFASAAAAMPDGGRAVAAELSNTHSAPTGTATPGDSRESRQIPDPDSAGSGTVAAPSALPSESASIADPNAPAALDASVLAQARAQFESDPQFAPIFELRNRFTDGDLKELLPQLKNLVADPKAFTKGMIADLQAAGLWDEQAKPADAPKPFTLPEADLSTEDGSLKAFSAQAVTQIINDLRADLDAKYTGMMQPILTDREAAERQASFQANYNAKLTEVSAQTARARAILPDFKTLEPQIKTALEADFKKPAHMQTLKGDIYAAYAQVKQSHPQSLQTADTSRQAVLDDLKKKAEAGTGRQGSRATAGGDSRPAKSFAELAQRNKGLAESAASSIVAHH